jgi:hypothetical protein
MMRALVGWGACLLLSIVVALGCGSGGGGGTPPPGSGGTSGSGAVGGSGVDPGSLTFDLTVNAAQNFVTLDGCGFQPASFPNVAAGTYTIALTASTLTKGGVSGPNPPPPSVDNYVIVYVPLPAGDPHEDHRFFMLNGIGASASITLPAAATIQVMFIDSDEDQNSGTGTVTLTPGGMTTSVSAVTNDLAYDTNCHSMPTMQALSDGNYRATLMDSSFSSGGGRKDDFVLIRTPSEVPMKDDRYVILNGDGSSHDFTPFNSQTVRLWYIGASAGTGIAHVKISRL